MLNYRHISISLRLTMWFGSIFLVGSLLFGMAMWFNLKRTLTGERYQTLAHRVDRLQNLLLKASQKDEWERFEDFRDFAHATGNGLAEVLRPDGRLAYPSPSAASSAFSWPHVDGVRAEQFLHVDPAASPTGSWFDRSRWLASRWYCSQLRRRPGIYWSWVVSGVGC